jgi:hypothetical protein
VDCIDFSFNRAKSIVVDVVKPDNYLHNVPSLYDMQEAVPRPWPLVTAFRMTSIPPPARIVYRSTQSATTSLDIVDRFAPPLTHAHGCVERIRVPTHTHTHTHTPTHMMDAYVETDVWFADQGRSHPGTRSPRPNTASQLRLFRIRRASLTQWYGHETTHCSCGGSRSFAPKTSVLASTRETRPRLAGPWSAISTASPMRTRCCVPRMRCSVTSCTPRGVQGCGGDHYTGITATDPGDVRSVRVTLPDGNAGNLQPVLCDILESGVDQGLHRPGVHAMPSGQARGVFARGARENAVRALAHRRVVRV